MYKKIATKFNDSNRSKQIVKFIDPYLSSIHAFDDPNSSKYFYELTSARRRY